MNTSFIDEIAGLLTDDEQITDSTSLEKYNGCTYKEDVTVNFVIKPIPQNHAETLEHIVVKIIEVAKKHRQPIYTISKGKNWGYGSALPKEQGCVLLDLSNFNKISHFDSTNGTIRVEPGVTQLQLYQFLQKQGGDWWMDATGGPANSSILGNYCERGFGHTAKGDHFRNLVNLSAVIPKAENVKPDIIQTAYLGFENAACSDVYEYGLGPFTTGIFTQSNLGIVCQITIKLMPKPQYFKAYLLKVHNADFPRLIDEMSKLKKQGVIESSAHVVNAEKVLELVRVMDRKKLKADSFRADEELIRDYGIADWTVSGAFYGYEDVINAKINLLKSKINRIPHKLDVFDDKKLKAINKIDVFFKESWFGRFLYRTLKQFRMLKANLNNLSMLDNLNALIDLKKGKPSDYFIRSLYNNKNDLTLMEQDDLDPHRDNVGLIWLAPIAPMEGIHADILTAIIGDVCKKYNFAPTFSITLLTETAMDCVFSLIYDRDDSELEQNAILCHNEILSNLGKKGYYVYRYSTISNKQYKNLGYGYSDLNQELKAALDPLDILSPGHYIH